MHKLFHLALIPALMCSLTGKAEVQQAKMDTVLYHNATLINPANQQRTENGWLLVQNGSIIDQGQANATDPLPKASQQINLKDQYVMPGLIDVHLHLTAGPHRVEMVDGAPTITMKGHPDITRYHAISTLATGVTTAFSPAGEPEANAQYAKAQQQGLWLGPQLFYAGYIFEPMPILGGSVYPKDEAGWQAEIARQKALGVQVIKLYFGLGQAEVAMGIRLAKAAGLKTIAHLDQVSWQFAADQGIDMLTHALPTSAELLTGEAREAYLASRKNPMNQRFIYQWFEHVDYNSAPMQQLFNTLARQQTRLDLTLVVNELFYFARELERLYPEDQMWVFHPQSRNSWRGLMAAPSYDWTKAEVAKAQQQMPKVLQLFKRLYDAGVPLAIGTDLSASGPFYLRELELSKAAGLSNWQVLQLATVGGAKHLGLQNLGELKAGFVADFIVLSQDPTQDLTALNSIQTVVQGGKAHQVAELRALLPALSQTKL
ncbi:amidohydrolase family protein [Rheinheimera sp. 4Y26]|uniref:amidohydrolase family protein n=1 Tax=Rheinheimera sp. 4Y26 TaxID=2977811 RepID=UPI0021B0E918|nr:amidohydrolase family protein [Rheinheimera sp. 4Y26]MCT6698051.1 amidohydrolase family protein [Rheinheimera sp. 4Y26]